MKKRFEDVERIRRIQQTSLEMMTVMHRGLSAIARGELSEVGALAMKRLAGQTLDEVQSIALDMNGGREEEMGRKGAPLPEVDVPTGAQASLPAINAQRSKT